MSKIVSVLIRVPDEISQLTFRLWAQNLETARSECGFLEIVMASNGASAPSQHR